MISVLPTAAVMLLAVALRVVPQWLAPGGAGIDHWFWKTYVETYRRQRRFPPDLPQYILDGPQWYPPVFPLVMSSLPAAAFDRWSHAIALIIDLLRMLFLLAVAAWQSNGSLTVMVVAGLVYATTPIQVSYNIQLNPRGLAALMLDALLVLLLLQLDLHGPPWIWIVVAVLTSLILLTHKMTTQLLWVIILGTAIIYRNWALLLLVPVPIALALILSRGFYWKILRAHFDIVSFWNRHWRWHGADIVRESPVYGDGVYERPVKLHRAGWRGFLWQCFVLLGFNPSAWVACLLVYERLFVPSAFLIYPTQLLVWLLLPCALAVLTTFVPQLKCIGPGYLYVYNTSLVASLLLGLTFHYTRAPELSTPFVALAIAANIVGVILYYRQFLVNKRARVHEGLDALIQRLGGLPRGVVMCLPANWYEVVAYKSGQPVLWGAHGYGFKNLEPTYPRLLIPVEEIIRRYGIRYLLTMEGVLPANFVADLPPARVISSGEYRLYCFGGEPAASGSVQ